MANILMFHHALGLTPGVLAYADRLRTAGHTVHTPDLFEGKRFTVIADGVANAQAVGFGEIIRRGVAFAEGLPADLVYAGFSMGVLPAQQLAQTRPGARGALFYYGCTNPAEFGTPWPDAVPLQVHIMENDPWAEEDLPAARALAESARDAKLFLYPGKAHLFADESSEEFVPELAAQLEQRSLEFLSKLR